MGRAPRIWSVATAAGQHRELGERAPPTASRPYLTVPGARARTTPDRGFTASEAVVAAPPPDRHAGEGVARAPSATARSARLSPTRSAGGVRMATAVTAGPAWRSG